MCNCFKRLQKGKSYGWRPPVDDIIFVAVTFLAQNELGIEDWLNKILKAPQRLILD